MIGLDGLNGTGVLLSYMAWEEAPCELVVVGTA